MNNNTMPQETRSLERAYVDAYIKLREEFPHAVEFGLVSRAVLIAGYDASRPRQERAQLNLDRQKK